ncbi:bifunctional nuclease family protein [Dehalogenimonas sp. THU2]|uniref:bifunctional nuclease family protein n=1 Tax=Dehalogenimonas sp. THU2 TaxID=3151121 RepID=UPI003218DD0C
MIEMTIESIRVSLVNYQRVVMLKEKNTLRYLPIWIGSAEAQAIAIRLQEGIQVQRPMTHDLLATTIEVLGAKVEHVIVNDLKNDTFYAKILLNFGGNQLEIDSRPSDALALAVRVDVPIYADESVLDKAGIVLERESEGGADALEAIDGTADVSEKRKKASEDEIKKMSAFRDFIDNLDLEDFDKRKS